jgi:hypothetical protein
MSKDVAMRMAPDFMEMSMVNAKFIPLLWLTYKSCIILDNFAEALFNLIFLILETLLFSESYIFIFYIIKEELCNRSNI